MKHSTKAMVALLAIPALSVGASAVAAHAETGSASSIVDASMSTLGISLTNPTLLDELTAEVQIAIDAGVVDPSADPIPDPVIEPTAEPTVEPSAEPTTEPSAEPTTEPSENPTDDHGHHLGHLHDQFELWAMASPVWNAAFETIRLEFEACIVGADPNVDCSAQTLTALQLAHADVLTSTYDELAAGVAALPVEQQSHAQALLDRQMEHAQNRLSHTLEEYATNPDGTAVVLTPELLARINDEIDHVSGHGRGDGQGGNHGDDFGDDDVDESGSLDDSDSDESDDSDPSDPSDSSSSSPGTNDSDDSSDDDDDDSSSNGGGRNSGNSGNSGGNGSHGDD